VITEQQIDRIVDVLHTSIAGVATKLHARQL